MDMIRESGAEAIRLRLAEFQALKESAQRKIEGTPAAAGDKLPLANTVKGTLKKVNELLLYHQDLKPRTESTQSRNLGNYIDRMA